MEKIAIFDFDGTLIPGNSVVQYLLYAYQKDVISLFQVMRGAFWGLMNKCGLADEAKAKNKCLRFVPLMDTEKREELDSGFSRDILEKRIRPQGRERIRQLKKEGFGIWIVSASTENYMRYIARTLEADELVCTRFDPDGLIRENCKGSEKLVMMGRRMREKGLQVNLKECTAFGDSKSDLPLLRATGRGILICPKRSALKNAGMLGREIWKNAPGDTARRESK